MFLAYAIALQAVLAAALGAQHSVAAAIAVDPAAICYGLGAPPASEDDPSPAPPRSFLCVVCAVAGLPAALPDSVAFVFPAAASRSTVALPDGEAVVVVRLETPRLSQGPPSAA